jgi:hypothetical protein
LIFLCIPGRRSDKWDLLTKKTFGFLLRDGTPKHGKEDPAWDIGNSNTHHNPKSFGFIEIKKKPDKSKIDKMLESVNKDENTDGRNNIFEPKFTWFGVQILETNVATNLAKHGNPFGGPNVQTRSGKENKLRKWKGQGRGNNPAWFADSMFVK